MEGYGGYPAGGGYGNNQRASYQYQNQYHPPGQPAQNPQPQPQQPPQQGIPPQLYHPPQQQQYAHQAYQPPTRQLRSAYQGGISQYDQMNQAAGQYLPPQSHQLPPQQQPYPAAYQTNTYQPPPSLEHMVPPATAASDLDAPGDPEPVVIPRAPKPVPHNPIKTKFPVARIKRIMQADEDVGKVAQVTPVIVSKALELFMVSLVTKAAEQAKTRGSKRITAGHLKAAVVSEDQFDFLSEIISKAPDIPTAAEGSGGGAKSAAGANSGPAFDQIPANMNNIIEEDGAVPRKGRRGRKKKVSSDDEDF